MPFFEKFKCYIAWWLHFETKSDTQKQTPSIIENGRLAKSLYFRNENQKHCAARGTGHPLARHSLQAKLAQSGADTRPMVNE